MKKYIIPLGILLALIVTVSCEVLDVTPSQSIASNQAIRTKSDLERALNGCYDALQRTGLTRTMIIVADLAADNLIWTGTSQDYGQFDNNTLTADNGLVEDIWVSAYDGINRVNSTIAALPRVSGLTPAEHNRYLGNLLFLRALFHFYLVRAFGDVPLKVSATVNTVGLDVERDSASRVYQQITEDLLQAENLLSSTGSNVYATKGAAAALLARVYLYNRQWQAALEKSTEVIDNYNYSLDPDFANIFSGNNSPEIIFQIAFDAQDRNRIAEYFFTRTLSGRKEVSPDTAFINAFPAGDKRKEATVAFANDGPYGIKYKDIATGSDNVIVLRLAEMYLIKMEAMARLNYPVSDIRAVMLKIRQRAGLPNVSAYTISAMLRAIEDERRLELAFEGHRWFDLVRTNRAIDVIPTVTADYQMLFPIPLSEIQANKKMRQNNGY